MRLLPVAVLFLALPVLAADDKPEAKLLPRDLNLVPADAMLFVAMDVGTHWHGPEAAALKKVSAAHPLVLTWWTKDMDKTTGLAAEDIDRAVLIAPDPSSWAVAVTTRKPFERDKVLGRLVPKAVEQKANARTYYTGDSTFAVAPVDAKTFLIGSKDGMKAFLERPAPAKDDPQQGALQSGGKNPILLVGFNPALFKGAAPLLGPDQQEFAPLLEGRSWQMALEPATGLRLRLAIEFQNEDAARKGIPILKKGFKAVDGYLALTGAALPGWLKDQKEQKEHPDAQHVSDRLGATIKAARSAIEKLKVVQKGKVVEATLLVETKEPATTAVLLMSLMPRAPKAAGKE